MNQTLPTEAVVTETQVAETRQGTGTGMHANVQTWDTECGCDVPHWWGPLGPESWEEHLRVEKESK